MKIYLDKDFKCHLTDDGTRAAVETAFFDDKCQTFIEGYRLIPSGESWTREDGTVFSGEMLTPWKDYRMLEAAQAEYEKNRAEMEDMRKALALMGVTLDG